MCIVNIQQSNKYQVTISDNYGSKLINKFTNHKIALRLSTEKNHNKFKINVQIDKSTGSKSLEWGTVGLCLGDTTQHSRSQC